MKVSLPKLYVSLRLKLALASLMGLTIMAVGSAFLITKIWTDVSRAYGITTLEREMAVMIRSATQPSLVNDGDKAAKNNSPAQNSSGSSPMGANVDWGFQVREPTKGLSLQWLKRPLDVGAEALDRFAADLVKKIQASELSEGSFELQSADPKNRYFIVFSVQKTPELFTILGTRSHQSLSRLTPWTVPFMAYFLVAYLLFLSTTWLITNRLTKAYKHVRTSLDFIRAGRLENLQIPHSTDPEINSLNRTILQTAEMLKLKDAKISEVTRIAEEDPMTGLPNYRSFLNYSEGIFSMTPQAGKMAVLLLVDLDFFKKINDNHGHQVGDLVLKKVAQIIRETFRMSDAPRFPDRIKDFCARYGGEEFVGLLPECNEEAGHLAALRLMHSLRQAPMEVPAEISNKRVAYSFGVTASIGIAYRKASHPLSSITEWIKLADDALYEAKRRGRNRVAMLNPTSKDEIKEWLD